MMRRSLLRGGIDFGIMSQAQKVRVCSSKDVLPANTRTCLKDPLKIASRLPDVYLMFP